MDSKPKCYGKMLKYSGMGGCGDCSLVADCEVGSNKMQLTKAQIYIITELLEMASEEFSNHGCNDYTLENTPENLEFVKEAEIDTPNISKDGKKIYTCDTSMMQHSRDLLLQLLV